MFSVTLMCTPGKGVETGREKEGEKEREIDTERERENVAMWSC